VKQLFKYIVDRLYGWSNLLMPFDIAVIYLLELTPQSNTSAYARQKDIIVRPLRKADQIQLQQPDMDFSAGEANRLWSSCECIGAFKGEELVGYAWHADGHIGAELNTTGPPFSGCAMELAADTQYLFKVFVHPAHRGQSINVLMCEILGDELRRRGYRRLVTLTEWNNHAFRNSVEPMGFRAIGHCTEWVLSNRSRYKLPDHLDDIARFSAA